MAATQPQPTTRKLFVSLPVKDLDRAKGFFGALGFTFDPRFTDDKAACLVVSSEAHVMLLTEPFFRTFTPRALADTSREIEGLFALSCESRAEVDALVGKALAAGGARAMDPVDHGFMYGWSFLDPDGHHWEVLWMDSKVAQG
jgi:uncharacterized protein